MDRSFTGASLCLPHSMRTQVTDGQMPVLLPSRAWMVRPVDICPHDSCDARSACAASRLALFALLTEMPSHQASIIKRMLEYTDFGWWQARDATVRKPGVGGSEVQSYLLNQLGPPPAADGVVLERYPQAVALPFSGRMSGLPEVPPEWPWWGLNATVSPTTWSGPINLH